MTIPVPPRIDPTHFIEPPAMPDDNVDRIIESLTQINVNLESLRVSLMSVIETTTDHEERLRSIERWKHHLTPVLTTITFILGAVFSSALNHLL